MWQISLVWKMVCELIKHRCTFNKEREPCTFVYLSVCVKAGLCNSQCEMHGCIWGAHTIQQTDYVDVHKVITQSLNSDWTLLLSVLWCCSSNTTTVIWNQVLNPTSLPVHAIVTCPICCSAPCRPVHPVYGGCGASEERGWRGDHVHPQFRGHDRRVSPRPQTGAEPPPAHLARHR